VLVEGPAKRGGGQLAGRADSNRWINFDGHPRLIGHFVDVTVTEALSNSLRGRVVDVATPSAEPA